MVIQFFKVFRLCLGLCPCVPIVLRKRLGQRCLRIGTCSGGRCEYEGAESRTRVVESRIKNGDGPSDSNVDCGGPACEGEGDGRGRVNYRSRTYVGSTMGCISWPGKDRRCSFVVGRTPCTPRSSKRIKKKTSYRPLTASSNAPSEVISGTWRISTRCACGE